MAQQERENLAPGYRVEGLGQVESEGDSSHQVSWTVSPLQFLRQSSLTSLKCCTTRLWASERPRPGT